MKRKAFTLVELIFVIVIMAIISMFAADLYNKIYISYVQARAISELESRTEIALSIIVSRLEDRIKDATIGRRSSDNTFVGLDSVREDHDILEWLGQSTESRNLTGVQPGWSGFIDLENSKNVKNVVATPTSSAQGRLITPGSNLAGAMAVMKSLMSGSENSFGIVFKNAIVANLENAYGFNLNNYNHYNVAVANSGGEDILNITNYPGSTSSSGRVTNEISEQYYLVHTAYAIVPQDIKTYVVSGTDYREFDLALRYNYQPWQNQNYKDKNAKDIANRGNASSAIIAENVTMFRFRDDNGALALKLCMRDGGRNFDPEKLDLIICKSQVVF